MMRLIVVLFVVGCLSSRCCAQQCLGGVCELAPASWAATAGPPPALVSTAPVAYYHHQASRVVIGRRYFVGRRAIFRRGIFRGGLFCRGGRCG